MRSLIRCPLLPLLVLALLASSGGPVSAQLVLAQPIPIDVPSTSVSGSFLVNGAPAPSDYGEQAIIDLLAPGDAAPVTLGVTNTQVYGPRVVIAGSYRRLYELLFTSGALPINPSTPIGPLETLPAGATVLDVDVAAIDVTFDLTLDGLPFPALAAQSGAIWLRSTATGQEVFVGTTDEPAPNARIVPGVYDVLYRHVAGALVPQNENAVILAGAKLSTTATRAVDVPSRSQTLNLLLNGAPFLPSPLEDGEIRLRDFATGDAVSFGLTSDGSSTRTVVAGVYDVTWSLAGGASFVPRNPNAVIAAGLVLDQAGSGFPLVGEIDVQAAWITLDATLNGGAFPASPLENGLIVLVGPHGDEVTLGETRIASPGMVLVVEGTYDVHYRSLVGRTAVPGNPDARVAEGVVVSGDATLAVDVPAIDITPAYTVDGVPFSPSQLERGDFSLVGELESDVLLLGSSHQVPSTVRIVPGRYEVRFDWQAGGVSVPRNRDHPVQRGLELTSTQTLNVNVATIVVSPSFTLDGAPFPVAAGERGDFVLRGLAGGEVDIGTSNDPSPASVRTIRDIYSIEYDWDAGFAVPGNVGHRVGVVNVPEPGTSAGFAAGGLLLGALARRKASREWRDDAPRRE